MGRMCPPQSVKTWPTPACLSARPTRCPPFRSAMSSFRRPLGSSTAADAGSYVPSLDDLVGFEPQQRWNSQTQSLGGLEIDHKLEFGGLLDRKVGRPGALEDLVDEDGGAPAQCCRVGPVEKEAAGLHLGPGAEQSRHPGSKRLIRDLLPERDVRSPLDKADQVHASARRLCEDLIPPSQIMDFDHFTGEPYRPCGGLGVPEPIRRGRLRARCGNQSHSRQARA